ncbi:hypothetical protein BT67DRAFT_372141 [Trichocladium antarcticum]|uniref:Uncharacterized protein n=1 Tax=Trichocladium antarcticum TaxID=1450529 RepID=A0AAN6URR9_9PEZI|nr:hypothetical protein BT67DRAFT_372141 [Trichocladium antarcticum]
MTLFHALIRTHHITSRKKVAHLRKAAGKYEVYALLRSGGCPGIMYCKGNEDGVRGWVATVQSLRYKDFHLASKPAPIESEVVQSAERPGLVEVAAVQDFAAAMAKRGISAWWKRGMDFA